jgi:hypothetical protein
MRIRAKLATAAVLAVAVLMLIPGTASAHAERSVGPFDLEIGFFGEPAYVGIPNAVFLDLSKGGKPVTDLGDALTVTVGFGDQTSDPFVFQPLETPGQYQAPFVPSQAGAYTFTLSGTLDGVKFDLSLTSGPKTFDEVQDLAGATFPPVEAPTSADLAARIQQESDRTTAALTAATTAGTDAQAAADSAKTVGIIGIIVGAMGLIVAIVALSASRKKA